MKTKNSVPMSIHFFCALRGLDTAMELRFFEYFKDFFFLNFDASDIAFDYFMSNMTEEEILYYFNSFLKHLRYTLPEVERNPVPEDSEDKEAND